MQNKHQKVQTLLDAIPYIKKFFGKVIVIKYGGSAQTSPDLKEKFAQDIVFLSLLGIKPVIVHGGGARITELLTKLEIPSHFVDGHRVTCEESMRVVEMVLSGEINKNITSLLTHHGAKAIGISGKDSAMINAIPKDGGKFGYIFLMFLGQFPAHCQFAGAENARGLSKAFLEAILALKKDERPRHMGKGGKQRIAA